MRSMRANIAPLRSCWSAASRVRASAGASDSRFLDAVAVGVICASATTFADTARRLTANVTIRSKMLASLPKDHSAGPYIRYNLGVALIKNGETADGTAMLELVGRGKAADEETRSLRDRANLALGFAALRQQRSDLAKTALERVRLSGMLANRALLGFGWADAEAKDPRRALVAWTELAGREVSDAAVLEARLAVPYAYSELGAFGQAMDGFNAALEKFDDEDNALDESIAAIRSGALLADLLQSNPGEEMGWFWNIRVLPDLPHSGHLAQVLAQHDFQEAFPRCAD